MVLWPKSHLTCINKVTFWKKHWEPHKKKRGSSNLHDTGFKQHLKRKKKSHLQRCSSMFPQGAVSRDLQLETSTFKYVNSREKERKKPKQPWNHRIKLVTSQSNLKHRRPRATLPLVPSIPTVGEAKLHPDLGDPAAAHIYQNAAQSLFLTFPSTPAQSVPPFVASSLSRVRVVQ